MNYQPYAGLRVTLFGKQGAEKWVRHAYNILQNVECWQPYRVLITSYGVTSYTAFYTFREFKQWLQGYKLQLEPYHGVSKYNGKRAWVARFGKIEAQS